MPSELASINQEKFNFVVNKWIPILRSAGPNPAPQWGRMSFHQMIEHMIWSLNNATGKLSLPLATPEDKVPLFQQFLMTEKEFRPETKNAIMSEEPEPVRTASVSEAIDELESEVKEFEKIIRENPDRVTLNPIFGMLDNAMWVQLLHKHAVHHLKQFGLSG